MRTLGKVKGASERRESAKLHKIVIRKSMKSQLSYWADNKTFLYCFQMKKMKVMSSSQEFWTQVRDRHTLKKADSEIFLLWVNGIWFKGNANRLVKINQLLHKPCANTFNKRRKTARERNNSKKSRSKHDETALTVLKLSVKISYSLRKTNTKSLIGGDFIFYLL